MEKQKLNEDIIGALIGAAFFIFAQRFIYNMQDKIGNSLLKIFAGKKKVEVMSEAYRIFLELAKNKQFLKDLSKIIIDEGGLKKFIQKTKTTFEDDIFYWENFDDEGVMETVNANLNAIVKKILELPSVKKEIKNSYYEDKKLLTQKLGNQIWVFLGHRDFKKGLEKTLDDVGKKLEDMGLVERKLSLKKLLPKK